MNKPATKMITRPELKVGDVAHMHGARFEIISTRFVEDKAPDNNGPIMVAMGKWLDGEIVNCYFGPGKDWNFQGNKNAMVMVEV